ncbi:MAG: glycosyltransferase N-terminal domain-containing protein [Gammaproteobacteria bacterium]
MPCGGSPSRASALHAANPFKYGAAEVRHCYLPFDLPSALARFIERARPAALVIMETELWPNLLHCCRRSRVPVLIANARLSERSFSRYRRWPASMRGMLAAVTAQSRRQRDVLRERLAIDRRESRPPGDGRPGDGRPPAVDRGGRQFPLGRRDRADCARRGA